jgi:pimeloyl-ACP methyl ester carboxylesterase
MSFATLETVACYDPFVKSGRSILAFAALLCAAFATPSCSGGGTDSSGTAPRMDFARPDFYGAPFPSDDLLTPDGHVVLDAFPNPQKNILTAQVGRMIASYAHGFSVVGGAFVSFTDDLDPASLPSLEDSVTPSASVFLTSVTDGAPDLGVRVPIYVSFDADGGPFGAPHLLSAVPLGGMVLRPKQTYALVVTRGVRDVRGAQIAAAPQVAMLANGETPAGMPQRVAATYKAALEKVAATGTAPANVAGLAVFTTDDPAASFRAAARALSARPLPQTTTAPKKGETFDGYCVYNAQIAMPDYQTGTPPYGSTGGDLALATDGSPIQQRLAPARVVLTVPRSVMPAAGYPIMTLVRTGAGGDRPLVDRGVQAKTGGDALMPGTGPAMELAKVGFAGAMVDGPHGGPRNVSNGDEQFLMFNVSNPYALRDNVRESALELSVFSAWLRALSFDASDCPGVGTTPVRFDAEKAALMGHSMGATIAPLALAITRGWKGAVLSGEGGSYIENVMWKEHPLFVRPLMETLFGFGASRRKLTRGDPVLTLMQWALEPADPIVYARDLVREPPKGESPRQLLMEQGIVDHYILPPIANAMTLALGLDLAGAELDTTNAELVARPELTPLAKVLPLGGRKSIGLPASANITASVTAVVVQHPSDGIEDGHEIMFQTEPPKAEYRCFLASLAKGGAAHVPDGTKGSACP